MRLKETSKRCFYRIQFGAMNESKSYSIRLALGSVCMFKDENEQVSYQKNQKKENYYLKLTRLAVIFYRFIFSANMLQTHFAKRARCSLGPQTPRCSPSVALRIDHPPIGFSSTLSFLSQRFSSQTSL